MSELVNYVTKHAIRGACMCGKCVDAPTDPEKCQPMGHTSDVQFFKVSLKGNPSDADKQIMKIELVQLIKNHKGEFREIDLFDGEEHNFIDIGAWIGDQGLALMLMGMGELLGIWEVLTPNKVVEEFSDETKMMLAQTGYVIIRYRTDKK